MRDISLGGLGVVLAAALIACSIAPSDEREASVDERCSMLFKRAQVSVLLAEPDREERIRRAYEQADATPGSD